ncbi:glyceraldehyde-3-phosphate dehydrogenase-like protein [Ramicandelaber brevisporus]|nr:glyceraldehyde-3-phosphate dehydrogenase-like protein [Ramicandelaber brevisporus]
MTAAATTFVALIGPGQVGQAFLRQLATHSASARAATYPVALAAVANSRRMLLGAGPAKPLPFAGWEAALATASAAEAAGHFSSNADLGTFASFLAEKFPRGRVVIVDCSASDAIAARYPEWLQLRHSIVTPNKRAFSGDPALYKRILDAAADAGKTELALRGPFVYHESTVGAGLPVLSTLNDLVRTGDKLQRVEGILSGTLSYLFNSFSAATASASGEAAPKFSQIVKVAKDLGYTEPDPRDDLNGVDFARKVVILARLAGLHDVSLDTLHIENIVPEQLRGLASADEFMARLPEYDDHFDTLNKQALAEQSKE